MVSGKKFTICLEGGSPWGFRLKGGNAIGDAVKICTLNPSGKAASLGVKLGDRLLTLQGQSVQHLTHRDCMKLIKDATDRIVLELTRESEQNGPIRPASSLGTSRRSRDDEDMVRPEGDNSMKSNLPAANAWPDPLPSFARPSSAVPVSGMDTAARNAWRRERLQSRNRRRFAAADKAAGRPSSAMAGSITRQLESPGLVEPRRSYSRPSSRSSSRPSSRGSYASSYDAELDEVIGNNSRPPSATDFQVQVEKKRPSSAEPTQQSMVLQNGGYSVGHSAELRRQFEKLPRKKTPLQDKTINLNLSDVINKDKTINISEIESLIRNILVEVDGVSSPPSSSHKTRDLYGRAPAPTQYHHQQQPLSQQHHHHHHHQQQQQQQQQRHHRHPAEYNQTSSHSRGGGLLADFEARQVNMEYEIGHDDPSRSITRDHRSKPGPGSVSSVTSSLSQGSSLDWRYHQAPPPTTTTQQQQQQQYVRHQQSMPYQQAQPAYSKYTQQMSQPSNVQYQGQEVNSASVAKPTVSSKAAISLRTESKPIATDTSSNKPKIMRLPKSQSPTMTLLQKGRAASANTPNFSSTIDTSSLADDDDNTTSFYMGDRLQQLSPPLHVCSLVSDLQPTTNSEGQFTKGAHYTDGFIEHGRSSQRMSSPPSQQDKQKHWYKDMHHSLHKTPRQTQQDNMNPYQPTYVFPEENRQNQWHSPADDSSEPLPPKPSQIKELQRQRQWKDVVSPTSARPARDIYRHQPGRIEDYEPGKSSIIAQERPEPRYGSPRSAAEERDIYKSVQRGGDIPVSGFGKPMPQKSRDDYRFATSDELVAPPAQVWRPDESSPDWRLQRDEDDRIRRERLEQISDAERRRKAELERAQNESRRHADYLMPSQKTLIPRDYRGTNGHAAEPPLTSSTVSGPLFSGIPTVPGAPPAHKTKPHREVRGKARALYSFRAENHRELSFKKGDILYLLKQIDANWYEGEHHGNVGIFPVNYVEVLRTLQDAEDMSATTEGLARVKYDFVAQSSIELALKKGQMVPVLRRIDANWLEGRLNGRQGIFPSNYVELEKEPSTPLLTPAPSQDGSPTMLSPASSLSNLGPGRPPNFAPNQEAPITSSQVVREFSSTSTSASSVAPSIRMQSKSPFIMDPVVKDRTVQIDHISSRERAPSAMADMRQFPSYYDAGPASKFDFVPAQRTMSGSRTPNIYFHETPPSGPEGDWLGYRHIKSPQAVRAEPPSMQFFNHPPGQDAMELYQAVYRYLPRNNDELELIEGDVVCVLEKCDDGWYVGTHERTGQFGTFPGNYVRKL